MRYAGIELIVRDPTELDWEYIRSVIQEAGLEVPHIVTGELLGADGLCLFTVDQDPSCCERERTQSVVDMAACLGAMMNIGRLRGRLEFLGNVL
jgi:hypothetical protein